MPPARDATDRPPLAAELRAALAARADPDGFLPFDRFMDVALYGPGVGRYLREPSPAGPAGDYYTAPHVHPLFARTLAGRLRSLASAAAPRAGRWRIVELGPGDGRLGAELLNALGDGAARWFSEYWILDRSPTLLRRARATIGPIADRVGLSVRSGASIAEIGPFDGAVIANEVLDALPARRWRWDGAGWSELGYRFEGPGLADAERSPGDPASVPDLPPPGTVVERTAAGALVREVADHLVSGWCAFLDYGGESPELWVGHPTGTVQAIRGHAVLGDPREAPGEEDLSTFVDFRHVRAAARGAGLTEIAYRSQAEALGAWGFPERLAEALRAARSSEEEVRLRLAAKNLLFGFERFRVLELAASGTTPG